MTARIWDLEALSCHSILTTHTRGLSDLSWSSSGHLATCSDDNLVHIHSSDGTLLRTLDGHSNYVMAVGWGPTGMVASAGFDESVRLWDGRDGKCLRAISAHSDPVTGVSFTPDGSLLASSSYDGLM
jgi:COMPASS component SWD3